MKGGFSLIELLVALAILAIVSAIVVPKFLNLRSQASDTALQATVAEIQNAYNNWQALGGVINTTDWSANTGTSYAFLSLVTMSPAGRESLHGAAGPAVGVGNATAKDSSGVLSSTTIGLPSSLLVPDTGGPYAPGVFYDTGGEAVSFDSNGATAYYGALDANGTFHLIAVPTQ